MIIDPSRLECARFRAGTFLSRPQAERSRILSQEVATAFDASRLDLGQLIESLATAFMLQPLDLTLSTSASPDRYLGVVFDVELFNLFGVKKNRIYSVDQEIRKHEIENSRLEARPSDLFDVVSFLGFLEHNLYGPVRINRLRFGCLEVDIDLPIASSRLFQYISRSELQECCETHRVSLLRFSPSAPYVDRVP